MLTGRPIASGLPEAVRLESQFSKAAGLRDGYGRPPVRWPAKPLLTPSESEDGFLNTESHDDPGSVAADHAEDYLDALIDDLRDEIAAGAPSSVDALADKLMDHLEALPLVQRDPNWMPLMASILASVAIQRLAYRQEGLTPTEDQTRVLIAMAEATGGAGGCFSIPELASKLKLTRDEVYRHARALARLGLVERL